MHNISIVTTIFLTVYYLHVQYSRAVRVIAFKEEESDWVSTYSFITMLLMCISWSILILTF